MSLKYVFLVLSIVFVAIGLGAMFIGHGSTTTYSIIEGGSKGLGGVFFILYYILMLLGNQPKDKTASDHV